MDKSGEKPKEEHQDVSGRTWDFSMDYRRRLDVEIP